MIKLYLGNGEKALNEMDENQYSLSICDPPYGIGESYKSRGMGSCAMAGNYKIKDWDNKTPTAEYFDELFRISKNQIIFGANYFVQYLPPSMGWIFWDKDSSGDFSDGELAFTSFKRGLKKVKRTWMGMRQHDMKNKEIRIHPTQKPVALYKWLLKNYGFNKDGTKRTIVDTHFGSLSIGIACADMGFDLDAWEIDSEYFNAAIKRLYNHVNQLNAFVSVPEIEVNGEPLNEYMKQI